MSNEIFRPGDLVREISTGDEGFVLGNDDGTVHRFSTDCIYVNWVTGDDHGRLLFIKEYEIERVLVFAPSVDEANTDLTYFENFKLAKEKAKKEKFEQQLADFYNALETRIANRDFSDLVLPEAAGYDAEFATYLNETRGWNFQFDPSLNTWKHLMT